MKNLIYSVSIVSLLLAVFVGCSTPKVKRPVEILEPVTVTTTPPVQIWRTPNYTGGNFTEATDLIKKWAVHPEFTDFVIKKRKYFSHTEGTVVENMTKYVMLMGQQRTIPIRMYYKPYSSALGGWNGVSIYENSAKKMSLNRRAGHLLHETTHALGWRHKGNYANKFDNVNSFPYALGYDFEEFLILKQTIKLAEE